MPVRNSDVSLEFIQQKCRLVRAEADKVAMQVARLRGELVPADEVRWRHEEIIRMLCDRVMRVETVVPLMYDAARRARGSGMEEMRKILREELRDALDLGPVCLVPPSGSSS